MKEKDLKGMFVPSERGTSNQNSFLQASYLHCFVAQTYLPRRQDYKTKLFSAFKATEIKMTASDRQLTIGLPIYNEAARLPSFLLALKANVLALHEEGCKVKVIACLNGTTDHSQSVLEDFNHKWADLTGPIEVISSPKGKFLAQRAIASRAGEDPIIFADSDILLDAKCFTHLYRHIVATPETYVAYATGHPLIPKAVQETPFLQMQRTYYRNRERLPTREHFVARAFIIRNGEPFLEDTNLDSRIEAYLKVCASPADARKLFEMLGIMQGNIPSDDAYLSMKIVQNFDRRAIQQLPEAALVYTPNLTMGDFINDKIRNHLATRAILDLFPEFAHLGSLSSNHKRIIQFLDNAPDTEFSASETDLIRRRKRIVGHLKAMTEANPLGMARMRGVWTPTATTKMSHDAYNAAEREISKPKHSVEYVALTDEPSASVPRPAVLGFLFDDLENLLLIFNKRGFDVPGGHVDNGETAQQALIREIFEETGIELGPEEIVPMGGMLSLNYKGTGDLSFLPAFAARISSGLSLSAEFSSEIVGRVWMSPRDFLMCHTGEGNDVMSRLILTAQNLLFPEKIFNPAPLLAIGKDFSPP